MRSPLSAEQSTPLGVNRDKAKVLGFTLLRGKWVILSLAIGIKGRYVAYAAAALFCILLVTGVSMYLSALNAEKDFNTLYAKANDCVNQHDYKQAVTYYKDALSRLGEGHNKATLRGIGLVDLSKACLELNQTEEAAKTCSQALLLMRQTYNLEGADYEKRDGLVVARASLLLGRIYRKQEKCREAEGAYRYALRLEEDCLGPLYLKDEIIQNYAELLRHLHRDVEASRLTRSDNESYFNVYEQTYVANHLISKGKLKDGAALLKETATFAVDNNLVNMESVNCLITLAEVSIRLQEWDDAIKAAGDAIQMLTKSGLHSPQGLARAYLLGGQAYLQKGQLDKADAYLTQALAISRQAPEAKTWPWEEGKVLHLLAQVRACQKNYKEAKEYYNQAIASYTAHGVSQDAIVTVRKEMQQLKPDKR
jgi:tetratricopeptide (TPR) repeat protein